jgi:8-oxo-dGTP diphosphatase
MPEIIIFYNTIILFNQSFLPTYSKMPKKDMVVVNFRISVHAFIIKDNNLFIVKRSKKDVQNPDIWEIPGGRLELGEDPTLGLMREIKEETGMQIEVHDPLSVRHFERSDGQVITMIIFLCTTKDNELIRLSKEHSDHEWIQISNCEKKLTKFFHKEVQVFKKLYSGFQNL